VRLSSSSCALPTGRFLRRTIEFEGDLAVLEVLGWILELLRANSSRSGQVVVVKGSRTLGVRSKVAPSAIMSASRDLTD